MTKVPQTLTVRVPFTIRKRGGRKLVIAPGGAEMAPVRHRVDNAMIKALARSFRWRKPLETGVFSTIEEIAAAEKINASYVGRLLRMTLLAPDFVEAILDGRQPTEMTLAVLMAPYPIVWQDQAVSQAGRIALQPELSHADPKPYGTVSYPRSDGALPGT
jgi:hypothetical protein